MNTKHTPGPWAAEGDEFKAHAGSVYVCGPSGWDIQPIAVCDYDLDIEENEANARLIAAAPELLAVADAPRIVKVGKALYLGFQDECGGWSVEIPKEMVEFVERWDAKRTAALAKAEGGAAS